MEKLDDAITVTPQVVSSSAFHPMAIECMVEWYEKNDPSSGYLPKLREWRNLGRAAHLPVVWGSHWACDAPLYLNYLIHIGHTKEQLYGEVCVMHEWGDRSTGHIGTEANERAWQRAFRVAESIRHGKVPNPDR